MKLFKDLGWGTATVATLIGGVVGFHYFYAHVGGEFGYILGYLVAYSIASGLLLTEYTLDWIEGDDA